MPKKVHLYDSRSLPPNPPPLSIKIIQSKVLQHVGGGKTLANFCGVLYTGKMATAKGGGVRIWALPRHVKQYKRIFVVLAFLNQVFCLAACPGGGIGLVKRNISLKYHLATNFSHFTRYCGFKNTWADPRHLHLTMRFHFSVIMGITMGNDPKNRLSLKKPFLMVLVQF